VLLRFALLCLIGALMAGVFGFEDGPSSLPVTAGWARLLFVPLLAISVASYTGATLAGRERSEVEPTDMVRHG